MSISSLGSLVLQLLPTSGSDATSSLIGTIYGYNSAGGSNINPITALQSAQTNEAQGVKTAAAEPETAHAIAAFKAAVASAKTPSDLLNNPQALTVLLTANGLGSYSSYTALAKKALLSDTTQTDNFASTLSDSTWETTAKTYDFANKGLTVLQQSVDTIANAYAEVQWRNSLDTQTPGLSNALDFLSRASSIKTVDDVLGDSTFRTVVLTALQIPVQIAYQDLEAQEKAVSTRIDVSKFQDSTFVKKFVQQYLTLNDSGSSSGSSLLV